MSQLLKTAHMAYESMCINGSLEKVALRAWKANIGSLCDKSKKLLESHGILDHNRELCGLNKGSENIVKRYGGSVTNISCDEFADHFGGILDSEPHFKAMVGKGIINKQQMIDQTRAAMEYGKGHMSSFYGSNPAVNKGYGIPDVFDTGRKKHLDYTNAILHRHEVDELRYARTAMKDPRKHVDVLGSKMPTTIFGATGHISPKVIAQESAHVAIAPNVIKRKFQQARTSLRHGAGDGKIMTEFASDNMGKTFNYGQSGKVDKALANKMERTYSKQNKPRVEALKNMLVN